MNVEGFSIGVDVGGTNIKFCVADSEGSIRTKHRIRTPTAGCLEIIDAIVANIPVVLHEAGIELSQVESIGLGIPGSVDPERGMIVFAPNIFATNVEIVKEVRRRFDVPIHLAQDSHAAAWAEHIVGAGIGMTSVVTLTLGTGIGCGIVIDGKIFRGSLNYTVGELGHLTVEFNGEKCNCGRRGCLEAYAGGLGIMRAARKRINKLSILLGKSDEVISVKDVFGLAMSGNAQAQSVVRDVVKYLGIGIANLANLMSPELITLSGGISDAPPELLFDPLVEFVRRNTYPTISNFVKIRRSPLGGDAPLIGVAILHKQTRTCAEPEMWARH